MSPLGAVHLGEWMFIYEISLVPMITAIQRNLNHTNYNAH